MAIRVCFISKPGAFPIFKEVEVDFQYFNGFALSQKQKSIESLHKSIHAYDQSLRVLEISTKSTHPAGIALSAFNLKYFDDKTERYYPLENVFQSSKVFEYGGPYRDLLNSHPRDAKRDERLKTSGKLTHFYHNDTIWELEPASMFYDWIYIQSILRKPELADQLIKFNAFTDIEFNHKKSINCQARSAAIFVSLYVLGEIQAAIDDKAILKSIYPENNSMMNRQN